MDISKIKEIISLNEYNVYGLRCDYESIYSVGDHCSASHQWFQDDMTLYYPEWEEAKSFPYNEELGMFDAGKLNGTCAIHIHEDNILKAVKMTETYFGDNVYLIAGNSAEEGNDIGEVVIENAIVLAAMRKEDEDV